MNINGYVSSLGLFPDTGGDTPIVPPIIPENVTANRFMAFDYNDPSFSFIGNTAMGLGFNTATTAMEVSIGDPVLSVSDGDMKIDPATAFFKGVDLNGNSSAVVSDALEFGSNLECKELNVSTLSGVVNFTQADGKADIEEVKSDVLILVTDTLVVEEDSKVTSALLELPPVIVQPLYYSRYNTVAQAIPNTDTVTLAYPTIVSGSDLGLFDYDVGTRVFTCLVGGTFTCSLSTTASMAGPGFFVVGIDTNMDDSPNVLRTNGSQSPAVLASTWASTTTGTLVLTTSQEFQVVLTNFTGVSVSTVPYTLESPISISFLLQNP
jgi:hypothetical protein